MSQVRKKLQFHSKVRENQRIEDETKMISFNDKNMKHNIKERGIVRKLC
jgi:hypothetical protein